MDTERPSNLELNTMSSVLPEADDSSQETPQARSVDARVSDLAKALTLECKGDREVAQRALEMRILADPALSAEVTAVLLQHYCAERVRVACHQLRSRGVLDRVAAPASSGAGILAAVAETRKGLLETYMLQNCALGAATTEDLKAEISWRASAAATHQREKKFLQAILQGMGAAERVRDAFTEEKIAELRR